MSTKMLLVERDTEVAIHGHHVFVCKKRGRTGDDGVVWCDSGRVLIIVYRSFTFI
eukprot:m.87374 g.87374  ORF g.87374 m.87374 type:complete len:55 (+) comp19927_c0_seq1:129-293(+)